MLIPLIFSVLMLQFPPGFPTQAADPTGATVVGPGQSATVTATSTTQPGTVVQVQVGNTAATQPAQRTADVQSLVDLTRNKFDNLTIDQLSDPFFWIAFGKDALYWAIGFIPRLFVATFLLFFFWLIYRMVRKIVVGSMKAAGVDQSICEMFSQLLKWSIVGFGLIIAGNQIGIQIAALLTGVSIIGLAVGFAAQESLSNFIAGIMIFMDKPFKVGDWILVDDHLGHVDRVTFRSTRLTSLDGDLVIFPNVFMLSNRVINKTSNPTTRVNVPVGIAYKESIEKARETLLSTIVGDDRIVKHPEPEVIVKACGASSVDLVLHFWIREEKYESAMMYEFLEKSKIALDKANIEIPFPHVQLLLEKTPALELLAKIDKAA